MGVFDFVSAQELARKRKLEIVVKTDGEMTISGLFAEKRSSIEPGSFHPVKRDIFKTKSVDCLLAFVKGFDIAVGARYD